MIFEGAAAVGADPADEGGTGEGEEDKGEVDEEGGVLLLLLRREEEAAIAAAEEGWTRGISNSFS